MANLHVALICSLAWCVAALGIEVVHSLALGLPRAHATARAPAWRGVAYAFGPGMLPWNKDGARRHPGVFVSGVLYHVGIFSGLAVVFSLLLNAPLPPAVRVFAGWLALGGVGGGLVMLVRRARSAALRRISAPDDYASNVIVSLFLACVVIYTREPGRLAPLLSTATVMLAYAPLGKIRHCVFFALARGAFALTFGRRGVLGVPHGAALPGGAFDGPAGGGCA